MTPVSETLVRKFADAWRLMFAVQPPPDRQLAMWLLVMATRRFGRRSRRWRSNTARSMVP